MNVAAQPSDSNLSLRPTVVTSQAENITIVYQFLVRVHYSAYLKKKKKTGPLAFFGKGLTLPD